MTKQRSATERLEDLENATMGIFQTMDRMATDLMTIKDAIKLLGNKVDSIVKSAERGLALNDDNIAALMTENNVLELENKVKGLVEQGVLTLETTVSDNSFVVGREIDTDGKIVNPRLQFTLAALNPEVKAKISGSTVGQVLDLEEGKLKFEVLESYSISQSPAVEAAPEAPAPEAAAEVTA